MTICLSNLRKKIMRQTIEMQHTFGNVDISQIKPNPKSRDGIDRTVLGLQYMYVNTEIRKEVFSLLLMFIWLFTVNPIFIVYIVISIANPNSIIIRIQNLFNLDMIVQSNELSSFIRELKTLRDWQHRNF